MLNLKILILSWRGPGHPLAGGAEIATFEHAKGWVKAGNEVTLFTSSFKGSKSLEIIDGVRVIRHGFDIFGVHISAFLWYLLNYSRFDLVVDEFHGIPFFTPLYVRAKKIGWIHEVAKEVWWLNPWPKPFNLIPGIIGRSFEPLIFLFYKKIPFMTVSASTKQDLVDWGIPGKNITIVYNGVNVVKVKNRKEKQKTVISLGVLTKDKGIEDTLKAFALISKRDKKFQFWIVGRGDAGYLRELKIQSRKLSIENKLKFWGFVDNRKKFELLSRAHVLLNPSVREGWGLVNIEANSVGTPVVGYNVPGVKDSVINNKTGLLSNYGNYQDLAENVIKLCNNTNLYNVMSKEAMVWAKKFTWEESTLKSLSLFKRLLEKH